MSAQHVAGDIVMSCARARRSDIGKRGPPPTPTPILKLSGSWRVNQRHNEPQPEPGPPDKPDWLDDYAHAHRKSGIKKQDLVSRAVQLLVEELTRDQRSEK